MNELTLSAEMIAVLGILGLTMYLFVSEVVRVDVAALSIMILLGVLGYFWPLFNDGASLLEVKQLFNGFSSNAVMSIIAVMIIGSGLDKSGVMSHIARFITHIGGSTEQRIILLISSTVGAISSFMQNVGAAALFLPVVSRISKRTSIPMSRLLMPMGFCAVLGGTMTMIGSSPLILLNDLIIAANHSLPEGVAPMQPFDLFAVTPIGLALVLTGIAYFMIAGRFILPSHQSDGISAENTMDYFRNTYGIEGEFYEVKIQPDSPLINQSVEQVEAASFHQILIIAIRTQDTVRVSPGRDVLMEAGATLVFLGTLEQVHRFAEKQGLQVRSSLLSLSETLSHTQAGVAEIVIPPRSRLADKSLKDLLMRKTYGLSVLAVQRGHDTKREDLRDHVLQSGDTLVVHTSWRDLANLEKNRDFVIVTQDYPHEELRPHKIRFALGFFALALSLVLFTDLRLSIALFVGALGMILSGVLTIDEAYESVSWKTVFLLASLIPLGMAMESTHTAAWIAQETLRLMGDVPHWVLQLALALLGTFFTLVMSNVGATVLLVPLAINMAIGAGANPAVFALTVGIATSNSFLIPTHQVNALIMGPAGYRVKDFLRAGGIMTVLFLVVSLLMLNWMF